MLESLTEGSYIIRWARTEMFIEHKRVVEKAKLALDSFADDSRR